jgi:hypothetical protein
MKGRMAHAGLVVLTVLLIAAPTIPAVGALGAGPAASARNGRGTLERGAVDLPGEFAFVSNFEDHRLDGWTVSKGDASVTAYPSYAGEPVLESWAGWDPPQIDRASAGFVQNDTFLSFQADVRVGYDGVGFVGLDGPSGPVAVVGVGEGQVWAGAAPATAVAIGSIPSGTAQPAGWVYLLANVFQKGSGDSTHWTMSVFIDQTATVARQGIRLPDAGQYDGAILETERGTVDYTNLIFTTYQIALLAPYSIYNPMDGYGQGMGLNVQLLPAFTILSADFTLENWSVPVHGILSFQINAMNYTGTVGTSCRGFFQIGIDLDPGGKIAPWYVYRGCNPHYFGHTGPEGAWTGFPSPAGTRLSLSIRDNIATQAIQFQIVDWSVTGKDRFWNATIPYTGGLFYSTFTQVEWQTYSGYPIDAYHFNGTMRALTVSGGDLWRPMRLSAEYMLPIVLDAPPSWDLYYYDDATAGYPQLT